MKKMLDEKRKDDGLSFEQLGVDMLCVDESDVYKNLYLTTKMTRVAGLPSAESNRALTCF